MSFDILFYIIFCTLPKSSAVDTEISEMYQQLKHESVALKGGNLEEKVSDMAGSRAWLSGSVASFMGEVGAPLERRHREQEAQVLQLKAEGKSDQFITDEMTSLYRNSLAGEYLGCWVQHTCISVALFREYPVSYQE